MITRHLLFRFASILAASALVALAPPARAQIETAGELLVDVDGTRLTAGPVSVIPNAGTMGGFFEAFGGGTTVPVAASVGGRGTTGLCFDGNDYMQHIESPGGQLLPAAEGLVGPDATCTVEAWVLNPTIAEGETIVAWGYRGGPTGSNRAFIYGSHGTWGAVVQWNYTDLGWNGPPAAGCWHHLVFTFDGTTTRVYADGVLKNSEVLGPSVINIHSGTPISLATQMINEWGVPFGSARGSLTLGRLRIHAGVLSDQQIRANYDSEKGDFVNPTSQPLSAPPIHRYSFKNPATNNATGATIADSMGTAHGVVLGSGAALTGSRLVLAGGPSTAAAYVDLPNGLLSSLSAHNSGAGAISIEGWARVTGNRKWSRIFDFGSTDVGGGVGGELAGPGGGGSGMDSFLMTAQNNAEVNLRRVHVRNREDGAGASQQLADFGHFTYNRDFHFVVTWREATGEVTVFHDGVQVLVFTTDKPMSAIKDVNVWLGRSNWTSDPNLQGEFDELRIYDFPLSPEEVQYNFRAGPDAPLVFPRVVPAGPGQIAISWPARAADWILEATATLGPGKSWQEITDLREVSNGSCRVNLPADGDAGFFRLRQP